MHHQPVGQYPPNQTWVFAYGSLIWRPGFEYAERSRASLPGWTRRFWQASTDHRGVPAAPGRVVTLIRQPQGLCEGVVYRFDQDVAATLAYLDHRESGGYQRLKLPVVLSETPTRQFNALVYVADETNPLFSGPTPLKTIADIILRAKGPSGSNLEYFEQLSKALRHERVDDGHIENIAHHLAVTGS